MKRNVKDQDWGYGHMNIGYPLMFKLGTGIFERREIDVIGVLG